MTDKTKVDDGGLASNKTLRQEYAGLAMQGHATNALKKWSISQIVQASIQTADFLIAAEKASRG